MGKRQRRRFSSRRRRNKILRESNIPGKSKFSSSNSFRAGCTRVAALRIRGEASTRASLLLPEEIPRERGVEVRGRGVTLIVVASILSDLSSSRENSSSNRRNLWLLSDLCPFSSSYATSRISLSPRFPAFPSPLPIVAIPKGKLKAIGGCGCKF